MHITDPNLSSTLAKIEGNDWLHYERGAANVEPFVQAYKKLEAMGEIPFGDAIDPRWLIEGYTGDCVIYGAGGYARYRVHGDGEVVLIRGTTRPEKEALAESLGVRVAS